jgi:hypothetical protein
MAATAMLVEEHHTLGTMGLEMLVWHADAEHGRVSLARSAGIDLPVTLSLSIMTNQRVDE